MVCVQHCDLAQQTHPDGEWPFKIQEFHNLLSWLCASTVRHGAASTSRGGVLKSEGAQLSGAFLLQTLESYSKGKDLQEQLQ